MNTSFIHQQKRDRTQRSVASAELKGKTPTKVQDVEQKIRQLRQTKTKRKARKPVRRERLKEPTDSKSATCEDGCVVNSRLPRPNFWSSEFDRAQLQEAAAISHRINYRQVLDQLLSLPKPTKEEVFWFNRKSRTIHCSQKVLKEQSETHDVSKPGGVGKRVRIKACRASKFVQHQQPIVLHQATLPQLVQPRTKCPLADSKRRPMQEVSITAISVLSRPFPPSTAELPTVPSPAMPKPTATAQRTSLPPLLPLVMETSPTSTLEESVRKTEPVKNQADTLFPALSEQPRQKSKDYIFPALKPAQNRKNSLPFKNKQRRNVLGQTASSKSLAAQRQKERQERQRDLKHFIQPTWDPSPKAPRRSPTSKKNNRDRKRTRLKSSKDWILRSHLLDNTMKYNNFRSPQQKKFEYTPVVL
jgi:hypothetical protein